MKKCALSLLVLIPSLVFAQTPAMNPSRSLTQGVVPVPTEQNEKVGINYYLYQDIDGKRVVYKTGTLVTHLSQSVTVMLNSGSQDNNEVNPIMAAGNHPAVVVPSDIQDGSIVFTPSVSANSALKIATNIHFRTTKKPYMENRSDNFAQDTVKIYDLGDGYKLSLNMVMGH